MGMPKEYSKAPDQIVAMVNQLLHRYYPELVEVKFEIAVVIESAYEDDELCQGLKLHGMDCAATIGKISAKQRLYNPADALITLDGFWLDQHPEDADRLAVLDHEIRHVKLTMKKESVVIGEDGRAKFKMRPDELYFTGFLNVVERHGMAAGEAGDALEIAGQVRQALRLYEERNEAAAPIGPIQDDVSFTITAEDSVAIKAMAEREVETV
jgi:hypothetical protein